MNATPSHHLFLAAMVCGTAVILLPLWTAWPSPGDEAAALAARFNFAAGALCLAAVTAVMVWRWRRQSDPALAHYRKWTAVAIGVWAGLWALASLAVGGAV